MAWVATAVVVRSATRGPVVKRRLMSALRSLALTVQRVSTSSTPTFVAVPQDSADSTARQMMMTALQGELACWFNFVDELWCTYA